MSDSSEGVRTPLQRYDASRVTRDYTLGDAMRDYLLRLLEEEKLYSHETLQERNKALHTLGLSIGEKLDWEYYAIRLKDAFEAAEASVSLRVRGALLAPEETPEENASLKRAYLRCLNDIRHHLILAEEKKP